MKETERVRLVGADVEYFVFDPPGTTINVYGHQFTVMPGQKLECDMHKDFVDAEVSAGRVIRVNPESEKKAFETIERDNVSLIRGADPAEVDDDGFSMDAETIFGVGSMDLLRIRLNGLKPKSKIIEFIAKRFNIKLPARLSKTDLIQEALNIVETALGSK